MEIYALALADQGGICLEKARKKKTWQTEEVGYLMIIGYLDNRIQDQVVLLVNDPTSWQTSILHSFWTENH